MINVPISIASAMAASAVPTLTATYGKKDITGVRAQINSVMRFVMIISFPCAVGLAVMASPIFTLLFRGTIKTLVPLFVYFILMHSYFPFYSFVVQEFTNYISHVQERPSVHNCYPLNSCYFM